MKFNKIATVALFLFVVAAVYYTAGPQVLGKLQTVSSKKGSSTQTSKEVSEPAPIALGTGLPAADVKPSPAPQPIAAATPTAATPAPVPQTKVKGPTPPSELLTTTSPADAFPSGSLLDPKVPSLLSSNSLMEANPNLAALASKTSLSNEVPSFSFDRPAASPEKLAKADQFVTPEIEAAVKRQPDVVTKQHLPFEDTNMTVTRGILFTGKDGVNKTIPVTIPVRYRSGSIYLDEARLNELYAIEAQMQQIIAAAEELRVAASMLTERQNELLTKSVPKDSLKPSSFSVPGVGVGAQWARDAYRDVPQSEIKINQVK